ncbi:MAG: TatD family hydrolase [Lachnospiraceae bacterium]|nr:TatD family hydrolase [Lachnospiraceae bacterium]
MIFETHAHFDDKRFDEDRDEILSNLDKYGIETVINIGADLRGCKASIDLAEKYENVYASLGVHPDEIEELTDADYIWMEEEAKHPKDVAIGECGLDYFRGRPDEEKERQAYHFKKHIELSDKLGLPLVIHSRDAAEDTFNILKDLKKDMPGVVHCYSYSPEMAKEYVKRGWYIGVGGVVTFKNAKSLVKTVEEISIDRILLETDSPYLAPEPHRGERNDSRYLVHVVDKIAEIKGITKEEVMEITSKNAHKLFNI